MRPIFTSQPNVTLSITNGGETGVGGGISHCDNCAANHPDFNTLYLHGDQVGSNRLITVPVVGSTTAAYPVWQANFLPFGLEKNPQLGQNNYKFGTYARDAEGSQLDYAHFRYYGTTQMRFASPDPVGGDIFNPQSLNRYAYVMNSPLNLVDPLGLDDTYFFDGGCIVHGHSTSESATSGDGSISKTVSWTYDIVTCSGGPVGGGSGGGAGPDGGSGGGGGLPGPKDGGGGSNGGAANNGCPGCSTPHQTVRQCADDIANHWSIAGLLPGSPGLSNTFFGGFVNGLVGNNITNVTSIYGAIKGEVSPQSAYGTIIGAGPTLGAVGSSAPIGAQGPVATVVNNLAPKAVGEALQAAILPKWILDSAIYGFAVSYCKTGKY